MKIGIPKEIKNHEYRVALDPAGVQALVDKGHTVFVQANAGVGSGYSNEAYEKSGAILEENNSEIFAQAEMILKVKEPLEEEYPLIRENQIVFTYFHFASNRKLTDAMIQSKGVCISYETVEQSDGSLPLLVPMSEIAGRMATQQGAKYLERPSGGMGKLLGGVPGVEPATVTILGGGIVGVESAKMAAGLGAKVNILDVNLKRLRYLSEILPPNVTTLYSDSFTIGKLIKQSQLIIGSVLIPGAKAPSLIKKEMLKEMQKGTVLVDVAVDQGGCVETSKPTTHENPTFVVDGVIHYCVANMPGAVPYTSSQALINATKPYILQIANHGWERACDMNLELKKGLNILKGKVVYKAISDTFDLPFHSI